MKSERTWVLIADGGHAKVLQIDGERRSLEPQSDMNMSIELPPSRELVSDRPVRTYESKGHARHAKGDKVDPHRELKRGFARSVGKALEARLAQGRFERLVVVAPPPALSDLREALPKKVRAKVMGEVAQDLVKTPKARLWPHLEDVLGRSPTGPPRRGPVKTTSPRKSARP
jgi:protein required for attachment to host cells